MKKLFRNLYRQEEGATALEYALLVVLIAIVMSVGAAVLGTGIGNLFLKTGALIPLDKIRIWTAGVI